MDADGYAVLLEQRRDALTAALRAFAAEMDALAAARGTENADDEHDPEGATLSTEWSRIEGLRSAAVRELAEVEAARARWDAGTYGVCEGCGRPIPIERLRIRPMATRCVACADRPR